LFLFPIFKCSAASTVTGFRFAITHSVYFQIFSVTHTAFIVMTVFNATFNLHFWSITASHYLHRLSMLFIILSIISFFIALTSYSLSPAGAELGALTMEFRKFSQLTFHPDCMTEMETSR